MTQCKICALILCLLSINSATDKADEVETEIIDEPWIVRVPKDKFFKDNQVKEQFDEKEGSAKSTKPSENQTETSPKMKAKKGQPKQTRESRKNVKKVFIGPTGLDFDDTTTCDEFSQNARFNPYSVLDEKWFSFFHWSGEEPFLVLEFQIPSANILKALRSVLDPQVKDPIDWNARKVLIIDWIYNKTALLIERGDRGQYWLYPNMKLTDKRELEPVDIRLKQTSDNKYIAFMECRDDRVYALSRIKDIPPQEKLQEEAARFGYRSRRGHSYLYQGHEWMPIPEMDELEYWTPPDYSKHHYAAQLSDNILTDEDDDGIDHSKLF